MNQDHLNEAAFSIEKDFESANSSDSLTNYQDLNYEILKEFVKQKVEDLINRNFEKLTWILYRIDVDEEKLKNALKQNNPEKAPEVIAELIIERQLQKAKTRQEFEKNKNESGGDWSFESDEPPTKVC